MLDADPAVCRLFSRLGQVVAYGRLLHGALHDGCTALFVDQGFEPAFAHSMMEEQDTAVLCKTWSGLVKDALEQGPDQAALLPLLARLTQRLQGAIAARAELLDMAWITDAPAAAPCYEALAEPALAGGGLPLDRLVLDQANLAAALRHLAAGWAERGPALFHQAWALVTPPAPAAG
ncbi:hypothetical protein GALL_234520 [mine drainage metagenome]|uniref:Uncharacterized protein n=1 Tax=mine drainage metagenome TaxID=410659 RepID=A0A1J5RYM7_9ZZZZ